MRLLSHYILSFNVVKAKGGCTICYKLNDKPSLTAANCKHIAFIHKVNTNKQRLLRIKKDH